MFPVAEISWSDRLLVAGAVFRPLQEGSADWMARKSNAARAGLDVDLTQLRNGNWRIRLIDDQGQAVYEREHPTDTQAKIQARRWVRDHYQVDTEETEPESIQARPSATRKKSRPKSLGPQPSHLSVLMRARADDNEERAVALRVQADQLETEAKRLRAAADTMDGPDGQT